MAEIREIKDKTFIITGGASGLGALYAKRFLDLGAKKVAVLDIKEIDGQNFVDELNEKYSSRAIFVKCDVGKEDEIEAAFDKVVKDFQKIDVIINNAGIMNDSPQMWRKACEVNYQGLVSFTLKGIEHMRKDAGGTGGTIINIASAVAFFKLPPFPIYCGIKMAVVQFGQSLTFPPFFDRTGVRVLTMCFGATDTPLLSNRLERGIDKKTTEDFYAGFQPNLQNPESAVKAVIKMYQEGSCGSVWLSVNDEPGQDITDILENNYQQFKKIIV